MMIPMVKKLMDTILGLNNYENDYQVNLSMIMQYDGDVNPVKLTEKQEFGFSIHHKTTFCKPDQNHLLSV